MNDFLNTPGLGIVLVLLVISLPLLALRRYITRETDRIAKNPLKSFPQTPDEYLEFERRVKMAPISKHPTAYIIMIFLFVSMPFCFCSGLPCQMITAIENFFAK